MEKDDGEELIAGYDRDFSDIDDMQTAHHIDYCLYRTRTGMRLEVCDSRSPGRISSFAMEHATDAFAARLLQFLYENAAPVENACDIAQDLYNHCCML